MGLNERLKYGSDIYLGPRTTALNHIDVLSGRGDIRGKSGRAKPMGCDGYWKQISQE